MNNPYVVLAVTVGSLVCVLRFSSLAIAEKPLYRYQTAEGVMVQGDRLPAGAASRGYTVLNGSGDVIKVVPRELTDEERVIRDEARMLQRAEDAERERMLKWDQSLILRYSSVDDIDDSMRRGLLKYDTRIGILRGNLMSLKSQIEKEQGDAANYLRRGKSVPDVLTQRITGLKEEVVYAENAIVLLREERVEAELQFHSDRERFQYLMQRVSLASP